MQRGCKGVMLFGKRVCGIIKMGHKVNFAEFLPDTWNAYREGNGKQWNEWFQFETASNEAKSFSFLYFADIQNDVKSLGSRILRQACSHSSDAAFMLFAGELAERSERPYWDEFFYVGGWIFGMLPSLPVAWNPSCARILASGASFFNFPVYSCSQGRNSESYRNTVKPILEKNRVDLVLQGHDYTCCRGFALEYVSKDYKNPPMYVVSIGGPKTVWFECWFLERQDGF